MTYSNYLTTDSNGDLISPDDINATATIRANARKLAQYNEAMKIAAQLASQDSPRGQMAGQVYIPPNPLNQAIDLYNKYQGTAALANGSKTADLLNDTDNASFLQRLRASMQRKAALQSLDPTAGPASTLPAVNTDTDYNAG